MSSTEENLPVRPAPLMEAPEREPESRPAGITFRSILIGLILIPVNIYWVEMMEIKYMSVDSTCLSLFMSVIFIVFVLALINRIVHKFKPRWALSQGEILVPYIMLSISTAIAGHDMMGNLLPNLQNLFWFNTPENKWNDYHKFVPAWFAIRDKQVIKEFYLGDSTIWTLRNLRAWAIPVLTWSGFLTLIMGIMLCINVFVRKQWVERERLSFPIIQLPIAMTQGGGNSDFYRSRLMWIGFGIPMFLEIMNALNYWFPSVPYIQIKLNGIGQNFVNRPWNGVGNIWTSFYPFAIGLSFFLPADLSFSCWFFYLFRKLECVFSVAFGWMQGSDGGANSTFPYFPEQSAGAWVVICLVLLWTGRGPLKEALKKAVGLASTADDSDEPMTYRMALIGIVMGWIVLMAFCYMAGLSWYVPIIFFLLYFLVSTVITRVRAELGPTAHELNFFKPEQIMITTLGATALGPQNLTILTYFYWFNRGYRNLVMPHQLEAFKLGGAGKMESRRMMWVLALATVIGIIVSFAVLLDMYYKNGAATANIAAQYRTGIGNEAINMMDDALKKNAPINWQGFMFIGIGAAFALFLSMMKMNFYGWPLHPAGFGLAFSYAMEYFWLTAFIGWLCKVLITRYGGMRLYRQAMPFFLGLILGDFVAASLIALVGTILGIPTYRVFIF